MGTYVVTLAGVLAFRFGVRAESDSTILGVNAWLVVGLGNAVAGSLMLWDGIR